MSKGHKKRNKSPTHFLHLISMLGILPAQLEISKEVGKLSEKIGWIMSPGLSLLTPDTLCSL